MGIAFQFKFGILCLQSYPQIDVLLCVFQNDLKGIIGFIRRITVYAQHDFGIQHHIEVLCRGLSGDFPVFLGVPCVNICEHRVDLQLALFQDTLRFRKRQVLQQRNRRFPAAV